MLNLLLKQCRGEETPPCQDGLPCSPLFLTQPCVMAVNVLPGMSMPMCLFRWERAAFLGLSYYPYVYPNICPQEVTSFSE